VQANRCAASGSRWRPSGRSAARWLCYKTLVSSTSRLIQWGGRWLVAAPDRCCQGGHYVGLQGNSGRKVDRVGGSQLNASTSVVVLLGPSTGTATSAAAPVSKDPADESVSRIRLNISVSPRFGLVLRSSFRRSHPSKRKGRANGAIADKREDPKGHRQSEVWRDMLAPAFHANMFGASQTKRKGGEDARACE